MNTKKNFKQTGKGILDFEFSKQPVKAHKNTWRMLLIGPSNSGKTTALVNIIPYFPKPISSISYLAPSSSLLDEAPQKLGLICEKVGINWNSEAIDSDKYIAKPDMPKPEIVIFDDLYKVKKMEPYINEIFTRGRHNCQHGAYLTQSPAFVPTSVRTNYNYLMLHISFFNEDTREKFAFPKNFFMNIQIPENRPSDFLVISKYDLSCNWYSPPKFINTSNIFKTFKRLLPNKTDKINYEKITNEQAKKVKEGIELAGNNNVKKSNKKAPIFKIKQSFQPMQSGAHSLAGGAKQPEKTEETNKIPMGPILQKYNQHLPNNQKKMYFTPHK